MRNVHLKNVVFNRQCSGLVTVIGVRDKQREVLNKKSTSFAQKHFPKQE